LNISRYVKAELIQLELESEFDPPEGDNGYSHKQLYAIKEAIMSELVDLLDRSGKISNKKKLLNDLFNREKKASTAIGSQIAIPHVRTMQAREFTMAIGRHPLGYVFDAPDDLPVRLFFCMAAPPYDDNLYLKVFKALAERLQYPEFVNTLLTAETPDMIIRAFQEMD
jgi:mannitol/fructose-specific phosphotransferase system IIA component (Ntr-type)